MPLTWDRGDNADDAALKKDSSDWPPSDDGVNSLVLRASSFFLC